MLTVVKEDHRRNGVRYVICTCQCGNEISILASNLTKQQSCGCLRREKGGSSPKVKVTPGQIFGKLKVVKEDQKRCNTRYALCQCQCGREVSIPIKRLKNKKSCGCDSTSHGMSRTPEYNTWNKIKERCYKTGCRDYKNYGARGIKVCNEWVNSFPAFLSYIGFRPSPDHSLDRIDNDGNYEPGNVRWATRSEQQRNTRRNHILTLKGRSQCITAWAEETGIPDHVILYRLNRRGWPIERALAG